MPTNNQIADMISEARNAAPYHVKARGIEAEPIYIKKKAASFRTLNLKASQLPALIAKDGKSLIAAPIANMAGETIPMDAAIISASMAAKSGAHILIRPDQTSAMPVGTSGEVVLAKQVSHFVTVEAAPFATVEDDEDAALSDLPVSRAHLDWENAASVAVRFQLSGSSQKEPGAEQYADELMTAISIGLARAADKLLLAKIVESAPETFSIGKVAAQGISANELRGIVGTGGAGGSFNNDGKFMASGVPAELTGDMQETIIGAFNRCAVAIHEDVSILAERINANGALNVTCWASMIPLVPDTGKFWAVS